MEVAAAAGPPKPAEMLVSNTQCQRRERRRRGRRRYRHWPRAEPASALSMSGRAVNRVAGGVRLTAGIDSVASSAVGAVVNSAAPARARSPGRWQVRAALFDERCQRGADIVHRDALLGNFQPRDAALAEARFDDAQNLFGIFEIDLGDANAVVEAQNLRIKIGRVRGDDEAQRLAIELARVDPIVGGLGR